MYYKNIYFQIIPNLLLVKRDEAISLLVCTIFLHPEQTQREKLLQLLLNLKKKMEKDDRTIIISGEYIIINISFYVLCIMKICFSFSRISIISPVEFRNKLWT